MGTVKYMKLSAVFLALSLFLVWGCRNERKWITYRSEQFGFTVTMPEKPRHQKKEVTSDGQSTTVHSFSAQGEGSASYFVFYNVVPENKMIHPDSIFNNVRDAGLESVKGHLLLDSPITLDGLPGREIKIRGSDGAFYLSRVYLVSDKMFQVVVTTFQLSDASDDIDVFFNSFEILED